MNALERATRARASPRLASRHRDAPRARWRLCRARARCLARRRRETRARGRIASPLAPPGRRRRSRARDDARARGTTATATRCDRARENATSPCALSRGRARRRRRRAVVDGGGSAWCIGTWTTRGRPRTSRCVGRRGDATWRSRSSYFVFLYARCRRSTRRFARLTSSTFFHHVNRGLNGRATTTSTIRSFSNPRPWVEEFMRSRHLFTLFSSF